MAIIIDLFNQTIEGTDNADIIISLLGNDFIFAGDGDDLVIAGSGNDVVHGEGGDDILLGDGGNDILVGGAGNDLLIGGGGADTFVFNMLTGATGTDIVADFQVGTDTLDLTGTGITAADFSDSSVFSHDAANNLLTIDLGGGNSIIMVGISAAEFAAMQDDIVFDPGCVDITATAAAETFALPEGGCVTITGFELDGANADMLDLSAFGVTAFGLQMLEKALFDGEGDLEQINYVLPENDLLHWLALEMEFNGFPNEDGILDNNDIEVFRQMSLEVTPDRPFGDFSSQEEVDAFNQIIDAFLTYDFHVSGVLDENGFPVEGGDFELVITRDADGSEAGHLTLIGVSGLGVVDLFDNHITG